MTYDFIIIVKCSILFFTSDNFEERDGGAISTGSTSTQAKMNIFISYIKGSVNGFEIVI